MGKKKAHKQNPPKIPGQSREDFAYVFFLFVCLFRSQYFAWCAITIRPKSIT